MASFAGFGLTLGGLSLLVVEAALDQQSESLMETIA